MSNGLFEQASRKRPEEQTSISRAQYEGKRFRAEETAHKPEVAQNWAVLRNQKEAHGVRML